MASSGSTFGTDDAIRVASTYWGLDASAHPLPGDVDRNFVLVGSDGVRRILKVSPPGDQRGDMEGQMAALNHLVDSGVSEIVPRVLPSLDGEQLVDLETADGAVLARMVSYLDGTPLVNRGQRPPQFLSSIGSWLAHLDLALADFDHPGAHREMAWNIVRAGELIPEVRHVADTSRRAMVELHLENFRREIIPKFRELPHSVIHNDGNDYNILVSEGADGEPILSGLIDFGDIQHTVTVAEIGIACAYLMLDREDPVADAAHLTAGYNAVRSLAPAEVDVIFDLVIARLCTSVVMSSKNIQLRPENQYLQISAEPVWRLIENLTKMDGNEATARLAEACESAETS